MALLTFRLDLVTPTENSMQFIFFPQLWGTVTACPAWGVQLWLHPLVLPPCCCPCEGSLIVIGLTGSRAASLLTQEWELILNSDITYCRRGKAFIYWGIWRLHKGLFAENKILNYTGVLLCGRCRIVVSEVLIDGYVGGVALSSFAEFWTELSYMSHPQTDYYYY